MSEWTIATFNSGLSIAVLTHLMRVQSATILSVRGNLHLETIQLGELHICKSRKVSQSRGIDGGEDGPEVVSAHSEVAAALQFTRPIPAPLSTDDLLGHFQFSLLLVGMNGQGLEIGILLTYTGLVEELGMEAGCSTSYSMMEGRSNTQASRLSV